MLSVTHVGRLIDGPDRPLLPMPLIHYPTANLCVKESAYLIHIRLGNGLPQLRISYIGCNGLDPSQEC